MAFSTTFTDLRVKPDIHRIMVDLNDPPDSFGWVITQVTTYNHPCSDGG